MKSTFTPLLITSLVCLTQLALADRVSLEHDPLVPDQRQQWPSVAEGFSELRNGIDELVSANEQAEIMALTCQQRFRQQPRLRHDCLVHIIDELAAAQQATIVQVIGPFREKIRQGHNFADDRQLEFMRAEREGHRTRTQLEFQLQQIEREAAELFSRVDTSTNQMDRATRQRTTKLMHKQEALTSRLRMNQAGFERLETGQQAIANIRELYNRFDDFARLLELDLNLQTSGLQEAREILYMLLPLEETMVAAQGLDQALAQLEHERGVLTAINLADFFNLNGAVELPDLPDHSVGDEQLLQFLHSFADPQGE